MPKRYHYSTPFGERAGWDVQDFSRWEVFCARVRFIVARVTKGFG